MINLKTVYSSNVPINCHILKGRLETEGITCFIYDENFIWIDPFKAIAIGGVKLKVPLDVFEQSKRIIDLVSQGKLIDDEGEYAILDILENEINRQNEILSIKHRIRNNPSLIGKKSFKENKLVDTLEIEKILRYEQEFQEFKNKNFKFSWKRFLYELIDFDRSVFKYLRTKPAEYYIEKEIVENYTNQKDAKRIIKCPNCHSGNTSFGYAIDAKLDILYLLLSVFTMVPLFPIRKKYHCFDCGNDFNNVRSI